ncbi:Chromosome partition protein Smc [Bienertia sinuspersici]
MANDKEQGASRVSREETSTHKKKGARDPSMPRTSRQEWEARLAKVELTVGDLRDDSVKLMEVTETMEELEGKVGSCEVATEELHNKVLGGHSARLCPQRSKLNAMIAVMEEKESENEGRMGAMRLEEEAKLANLRLLNASKVVEKEPTGHASMTTQGADIK